MRERISQEEAKRFLRGPREAAQELAARLEQLRRWREAAQGGGLAYGRERVQEQGRNRLEVFACELADLEQEAWENLSIPSPAVSVEERQVLLAALTALDDAERQVILLHAVSGLKHREIAELLEIPLATALSKYHRGLKKLKSKLEGDGTA